QRFPATRTQLVSVQLAKEGYLFILEMMSQVRLTLEELHEIKWLMGGLITLLAFWSLASLEDQSGFFLFMAILFVLAPLLKPKLVGYIPAKSWLFIGPMILLFIIADFIVNIPNFIPPLVRLIIALLVYRSWAPRRRREDLQVILLSLFCLIISGVLTLSLLFAIQILLFAPIAMALLLVVCLLDRGDENASYLASWENFSWKRLLKRVWTVANFKVLGYGAVFFISTVCVSTLLFILTPRFNLDRAIPFLQNTTTTRSGFSESVGLNDVTEIQQDNSVALRIDGPSQQLIPRTPYWRMLILDKYQNGEFNFSDSIRKNAEKYEEISIYQSLTRLYERPGNEWTFYMEGGISSYIPISGVFDEIRFTERQNFSHYPLAHVYSLDTANSRVFAYQVLDLNWDLSFSAVEEEVAAFAGLETVADQTNGVQYPLTTLELNLSAEERAILNEVLDEIAPDNEFPDVKAFSKAVTEYLRGNFAYSLDPQGIGEGDPVVSWLKNKQSGHCQLFAGAFVLLAREADFPARMVIGYMGGTWNPVEDYFIVRNSNAHAWVEIYDAATKAWIRVDPTPGNGPSDLDSPSFALVGGFDVETGFDAWMDSLRIQWYRRVVNFDQEDQVEMAATIGQVTKEMINEFKGRMQATITGFREWMSSPLSGFSANTAVGILVAIFCILVIWFLRYRVLGIFFHIFRRPTALDPVRRQASRLLRRLKKQANRPVKSDRWNNEFKLISTDLEALRFGPPVELSQARPIFSRARLVLRKPVNR
ncbi:MAG: DUF3488 and transglutaminase-like domain-containing protein, partial [Verrucomicrobiota bacterium]